MTPDEVIDLLTIVAAFDRRTTGEADVLAWSAVLGDLDAKDAAEAVRMHFKTSTAWLMPATVRDGVRRIRDDRASHANVIDILASEDPRAVATAAVLGNVYQLPSRAPVPPTEAYVEARRKAGHDPDRTAARMVRCPWCQAAPGQPCTSAKQDLVAVHPARAEAAAVPFRPYLPPPVEEPVVEWATEPEAEVVS